MSSSKADACWDRLTFAVSGAQVRVHETEHESLMSQRLATTRSTPSSSLSTCAKWAHTETGVFFFAFFFLGWAAAGETMAASARHTSALRPREIGRTIRVLREDTCAARRRCLAAHDNARKRAVPEFELRSAQ